VESYVLLVMLNVVLCRALSLEDEWSLAKKGSRFFKERKLKKQVLEIFWKQTETETKGKERGSKI